MSKKQKKPASAQDEIIAAIRKKFGANSAGVLGEGGASEVEEVIPTGIEVVDKYVLGCGGLPLRRMVEVYGEEGSGKTAFTWACIKGCLDEGGVPILSETEDALNLERAETFGVDLDKVVLIEPDHLEDHLAKAVTAIEALPGNVPALFVWDSIASCATRAEVEQGLSGKDVWDTRAKTLSQACRVLSKLAKEKNCCLLFVNQVREKMGVMFGDKYTTPGGKAVKFHASIRLQLFPGKAIKNASEEHVGRFVTLLATKNRLASPYRKGRLRLDYAKGWDSRWSTFEHAKTIGLFDPALVKKTATDELGALHEQVRVKLAAQDWRRRDGAAPVVVEKEDEAD